MGKNLILISNLLIPLKDNSDHFQKLAPYSFRVTAAMAKRPKLDKCVVDEGGHHWRLRKCYWSHPLHLLGIQNYPLWQQKNQNFTFLNILPSSSCRHVVPLITSLRWLSVIDHIRFKTLTLTYNFLQNKTTTTKQASPLSGTCVVQNRNISSHISSFYYTTSALTADPKMFKLRWDFFLNLNLFYLLVWSDAPLIIC